MLQKSELQRLFHAHKGTRDCLARIAAEYSGQLSKGQIRSQLRRLGLQLKQPGEKEQVRGCLRLRHEPCTCNILSNIF